LTLSVPNFAVRRYVSAAFAMSICPSVTLVHCVETEIEQFYPRTSVVVYSLRHLRI